MIRKLKSFVSGEWVEGTGTPVTLYNPTTEKAIAETGTQGVDFSGCMNFARERGNPALRSLTFAQRGDLIGRMSKVIHEHREELIELSITSGGNTRGDAKFDLDGATGTLAYFASQSKKLGDRKFLTDGDVQQLGRNPRFVGQHIQVPFMGAAVQINAFNFPAWGFAEKAAVALLAGMPVVTKPATSTAVLSYRIMEIVIAADIFPVGALSFIAGSAGDLLDHLTCQDVLSFTGSSTTAQMLRSHPSLIHNSVRLNVEADSLNAAVLGPDADFDSKTYDLFLLEVSREMTQKAGQKCTAVRRLFVPEAIIDQMSEDLVNQIKTVRVGDPGLREVRMGPLATASQLEDVRGGLDRLKGCGKSLLGDGGRGELVGIDHDKGYFMSPVLIRAADPESSVVHDHEVFGPVQTLMPYSGKAVDASRYVNLGLGGLVSSVYTDDRDFAREMVMSVAPYHGRIHLVGEKVAEHSMGSGAVLPQMLHGGPGRAGGGEELGGLRGLAFYMQRTAIAASKPLLERIIRDAGGSSEASEKQAARTASEVSTS